MFEAAHILHSWKIQVCTGMSMQLSNYLVSWVVTYLGDLQPTYIGVIIYLLSSMDILVYYAKVTLAFQCFVTL